MHRSPLSVSLVFLASACTSAGSAPAPEVERAGAGGLSIDDVMTLPAQLRLQSSTSLGWLPDGGRYLCVEQDPATKSRRIFVVEASTGAKKPFIDSAQMEAAFAALPGVDAGSAKGWSVRTGLTLSDDKTGVLFNEKNDLFFHRLGTPTAARLTSDSLEEVGETLSPDGAQLAYISDWNLHVVPTDGSAPPRALTTAGTENLLHGRLDWVYQEEVYGRGNFGAFWWSPDAKRIAYLVIDETEVPEYIVTDHRSVHPDNEHWRYPKAGDPNPKATLHVVDVASGASTAVDLAPWKDEELLIVRVGWRPDSSEVIFQVQNRVQTWIDLAAANPTTGASRVLLRDSTPIWIEPTDGPHWIDGGARFLWESERDGWRHLYLYDAEGKLVRRVTEGPWEVDSLQHVDEKARTVYFVGDKTDVKGAQLWRCSLDGGALEQVTPEPGTHAISFSPDGALFLDTFSSSREWPRQSLRRADGSEVRELERVDGKAADDKRVPVQQFVKFKARDGFELEGALIEPPDFDEGRRFPVLVFVYGGPHAPKVLDRPMNSGDAIFHAMLAQEGYLVFVVDNRSCSGRGLASQTGVYKNLGAQELADIEDAVDWIVAEGHADPQRVGLWGWSYGGYMTAYALTHSKKFKCGIVGAPVVDWHLYDSIYTERLMDTPQRNPEGYKSSSALEAAANLHGKVLVIHGVIDENVHVQNSLQFAQKLQEAGILFELMLYPGNRHGFSNAKQNRHKYALMAQFVRANL
jgi:dipeptidyl-peptidase-4